MEERDLLRISAERTAELPGSALTHPFGEGTDVYKVRGRVFMLQTRMSGRPMVTLKARPADANVLREAYPEIEPGYHMNKRHWVTVVPGGDMDPQFLEDLVTESYLLVVEKLPRDQRPVDPGAFGQE